MTAIVILAAGRSARMLGRDKLMEQVDGMALLRRQCLRALETGCAVTVALPPAPHPRYGALVDLDVRAVPVPDADEGMNASLRAGLAALPAAVQSVMILLADMPDLTTDDLNSVLQAVDPDTDMRVWRAATSAGAMGHPVVFHRALFPALMALQGDGGASAVAQAHRAQTVTVPLPADHARTDLDTPEAWAAWRAGRAT